MFNLYFGNSSLNFTRHKSSRTFSKTQQLNCILNTAKKAHLNMQDVCSGPQAQLDNAEYQQRAIAAWSTPAWLLSEGLRNSPENSMCRIMIMRTNCLYQRLFSLLPSWCQAQNTKRQWCPTSLHANIAGTQQMTEGFSNQRAASCPSYANPGMKVGLNGREMAEKKHSQ